ncbi:MAG: hypothetical protein ACP5NP_18080, partial [Acetobacteraceae bacterium]
LQERGFSGYHVAGRKRLTERDLAPAGWRPQIPERFLNEIDRFSHIRNRGFVKQPFATWYVFDRDADKDASHGPARFSLTYLCADGIAAYQALYWPAQTAPEVLTIIQPGSGFGGNYTEFRDPDGFLAWTVLHGNGEQVPEYLVCGMIGPRDQRESFWPDAFPEHVEWFQHVNGNGVWRRRRQEA